MSEQKDQYIVAYITDFGNRQTLNWAIFFAKLLDKGIILLHISDKKYTEISPDEAQIKLKELNNGISQIPTHTYAALNGKTKDVIHSLGELFSAVMVVGFANKKQKATSSPQNPKNIIKDFESSRIAYFIFGENCVLRDFNKVLLPLNMLRESKEKVLWASYFGRFASSDITIYYKHYRDEFHRRQLNYNLKFAEDMLGKFGVSFTKEKQNAQSTADIDVSAVSYAASGNYDLIICQTTKNKSFIDVFSTPSELKTLQQMDETPILFLNPRDDLFVLCE
ncbi:MAG: hypothetical protein LBL74_03755 [Bacteroidales bacterium]|jgi:TolB-like protein|nr:hypothetical protein [Bacteroidales bacterium]